METTQKNIAKRKDRITYDQAFSLNGKTPPQAVELEEAVLGAMMLDQNALNNIIQMLREEYFYRPENQIIFHAILTLFEQSKPVDLLTVTQQLMKEGRVSDARGIQNRVNEIIAILLKIGVIAGCKEILNQQGFDLGECLPPFAPLSDEQKKIVRDQILPKL